MRERIHLCLVGTSNPENLGGVARLCANFGITSWALVAPRAAPDDHRALVVGRAARTELAAVRVTATLDEAVRDCSYVVGFSARRGSDRPFVGLRALGDLLAARAPAGPVALVFGPEDNGLSVADVERCDVVAGIELPGELHSLNLTQAVALVLWELSRASTPEPGRRGGATHGELEALLDHAFGALDAIDYFRGQERERKRVHLRRVLAAAALDHDEVRGLHGLCARLLEVASAAPKPPDGDAT